MITTIQVTPDTGEKIGDANIHAIERFIETQTVYGGDGGLKPYIKYNIMQLVRRLEDSAVYIKTLNLTNMYVSRRNQNVPVNVRQIQMYVTLYNYKGWGLDGGEYDGACVPNYLLTTYNNREETNPRNKISN